MVKEANFDGLIGPTHNYAGLSFGNVASTSNAKEIARPRLAVLQGLQKMKALNDLGMIQGVLPPVERPSIDFLRRIGFSGNEDQILSKVVKSDPELLAAAYSASSMWAANAATVSPSFDTADGRVHLTPANLNNKIHRSLEAPGTFRILKKIFCDESKFHIHQWLPEHPYFGDEGAANHTRFCADYGTSGLEFFVYGRKAAISTAVTSTKFPARQTLEASLAIARLHGLSPEKCVFAQQNPIVIDKGVFHNDVIAVGNKNVLFYHELAYLNSTEVERELEDKFSGTQFHRVKVLEKDVSVEEAVSSYLFNSQLISLPNKSGMALVVPRECQETERVWSYLQSLTLGSNGPISEVLVQDVRESMKNGGGPACLRLRVVLNEEELKSIPASIFMSDTLYSELLTWADKNYRDRLEEKDLADPHFLREVRTGLDELTQILGLGSIYSFQK